MKYGTSHRVAIQSLLFAVWCTLSLFPVPVFAASDIFFTGPQTIQVGQTFTVRVMTRGAQDVDTIRLNGAFPSELFEWQSMVPARVFQRISPGNFVDQEKGVFSFGAFSLEETMYGTAPLAIITLRAKKVGQGNLQLTSTSRMLSAGVEQVGALERLKIFIREVPEAQKPQSGDAQMTLVSSSHPNQNAWSTQSIITVDWKIEGKTPERVYVGFDQEPDGPAETVPVGSHARFEATRDGVWYVHLVAVFQDLTMRRADYRVQIDRASPQPIFPTVDQTNVKASIPNAVWFGAVDDASGIDHYEVVLDGRFVTSTRRSFYPLTRQSPGMHRITVKAIDRAGNITEGHTRFRIVPEPILPTAARIASLVRMPRRALLIGGLAIASLFVIVCAVYVHIKNRKK